MYSQGRMNFSSSLNWESDSSLAFQFRSTNFAKGQLVNFKIVNNFNSYQQFSWNLDSVFIRQGISVLSESISIKNQAIDPYKDTLFLNFKLYSADQSTVIDSSLFTVLPKARYWADVLITDSTLQISASGNNALSYSMKSSHEQADSIDAQIEFTTPSDTLLSWRDFILHAPFEKRVFELTQTDLEGHEKSTSFLYENGKLSARNENSPINIPAPQPEKKEKAIYFKGQLSVESNFFQETPQHSNTSQYPYTFIQASNTISVYGLPFTVQAMHSTNDNISPNFRNFFSFQFDVAQYRDQISQQLMQEELEKVYSIGDLTADIESNQVAIQRLEKAKELLLLYPNEAIQLDSALKQEWEQVVLSQHTDSLFQLDSLVGTQDSIPSALNTHYTSIDSIKEVRQVQLLRIEKGIERLNYSNTLKANYLKQLKEKPSLPIERIAPHALFSQFKNQAFVSTLLRFEKFELGNFYEYAGEYSIRDIEMRGINTGFLLNSENQLQVLWGRVNEFQSFNLDEIQDNKEVRSFAFQNSSLDVFQPTLRLTQFKDKTINQELSSFPEDYYVLSVNASGELSSFFSYLLEVNQSNENVNPLRSQNDEVAKSRSYFFQSYLTPLSFLDVKLQFDQVGSAYRTDGVYFLNRNFRAYTAGIKLRLFKNKLHLKNDFSIQERNFEQKSLTNKTTKQFYDIGTHFKRIPNLQVSYAPISVEVANQLDTSFSGLNANTNVLIARLHYFKKIKKTFISTALVYNEIENELADDFSTQKGIQHFVSITNERTNFAFTSSYDRTFASVRFISSSFSQQITSKLSVSAHLAKNFNDHFYSETIRSTISYQFFKQFNLGLGGIFLIENQDRSINSGGSISLRFNY